MGMTGTRAQVKDGTGRETVEGTSVTGSSKEILVTSQQGRESHTSVGGRQLGVPSRWMVPLSPVEFGGRIGCKYRVK